MESIYVWKIISHQKKLFKYVIKGNLLKNLISMLNQKRFHTRDTIKVIRIHHGKNYFPLSWLAEIIKLRKGLIIWVAWNDGLFVSLL